MAHYHNVHVGVSRAIEIALAGAHTVAFVASKETVEAFGLESLQEDVLLITRQCRVRLFRESSYAKADMVVELADFSMDSFWLSYDERTESFSEIDTRTSNVNQDQKLKIKDRSTTESLLKTVKERLNLTINAIEKILKVANTIAKLDGASEIRLEHVAEAIQYRSIDREEMVVL